MSKRFDHTHSFVANPTSLYSTSLEDWNAYRREYWEAMKDRMQNPQNYPNGILCPKCGANMYDTGQMLSTSPNMLRVKCTNENCKHKDARYE